MKPLIVLILGFLVCLVALKLCTGFWIYSFSGNVAMSFMLIFTAIGHFIYTNGMQMMFPEGFPLKIFLVYLTGIVEIAAAIGLIIPNTQLLTSYWLIAFFILVLPVNIQAAIKRVDYQKGIYKGPGKSYLWFRIPLQVFFIAWVYYCNIF